jgi:CubicO group peptidase (beta-lactamase class C family)
VILIVVLAALDEGVAAGRWESISAALDTPVVPELGCGDVSGPIAGVTLRQLLSFTSGVLADHDCVDSGDALQGCACEILRDSAAAMTTDVSRDTRLRNAHPPGATYKYGASHHALAGAWLERAVGEPWEALFARFVRAPLGVDMRYRRSTNLAGSVETSVADCTRFVGAQRAPEAALVLALEGLEDLGDALGLASELSSGHAGSSRRSTSHCENRVMDPL